MNHENISKYLSGEMNKNEHLHFESELQINSDLKDEFDSYKLVWNNITSKTIKVNTETAWNTISSELNLEQKKSTYLYLKVASVICFILFASFWSLSNPTHEMSETNAHSTEIIQLVDGSVIKLNKNSKITYFTSLTDSVRLVYLEERHILMLQKMGHLSL